VTQTYYITTPIYYVNDVPHIGHAYTTIACDVLSRYYRSEGVDVRFGTGTDEHGIKIVKASAERNMKPRELADEVVVGFRDLWEFLNISHDDFIRTTEDRHENRVQALVAKLVEADEIYLGNYEGWYDESEEQFITESTARENEYKGELSGKPLTKYSESSYFFRLSKWAPKLIEYIEANPSFVQPKARRNEVLSKLRMGVEDLSISRSVEKLPWGVPMPNDPSHVVYVWIDALSNYYTSLGLPAIGDEFDNSGQKYWPCNAHVIGKDILWFHTVYWPCMLMSLGIELPKCVFAHGWWTSEGKKMSKTLGNFISREQIKEICDEYSVDIFRYYLLRAVAFGADGDFCRDQFKTRYNAELANGVGNLLSRTSNMIGRYFDGIIPQRGDDIEESRQVIEAAEVLNTQAQGAMEQFKFQDYLDNVLALTAATNKLIEQTEPFKLAKDETQQDRLGQILYTCAEAVRIILLYLRPFMPATADKGLALLGCSCDETQLSEAGKWGLLAAGTQTSKTEPLFPRSK